MMKLGSIHRAAQAALLGVALVLAAGVQAANPSKLVVFGDSLSDSGNNAVVVGVDAGQVIAANAYIPTFAYASKNYSNGPVWSQQFAALMGVSFTPSVLGGTSFAFGGTGYTVGAPLPSMPVQLGLHLLANGGSSDPNALYVLAGGGNDARAITTAYVTSGFDATVLGNGIAAYASAVDGMLDALEATGAQNLVVWNVPDIGKAPATLVLGSAAAAAASQITTLMNQALSFQLLSHPGVKLFDLFGFIGEVANDPASFGVVNFTDACGVAGLNVNCATALFYDGLHPTTYAHGLIADRMVAVTGITPIPEPGTWALMLVGLAAVGQLARQRRAAAA
jgi:outer membrane lipase/esterase